MQCHSREAKTVWQEKAAVIGQRRVNNLVSQHQDREKDQYLQWIPAWKRLPVQRNQLIAQPDIQSRPKMNAIASATIPRLIKLICRRSCAYSRAFCCLSVSSCRGWPGWLLLSIFVVHPFLNVPVTLPKESVSPSLNGVAVSGAMSWSLMRVELALFRSVKVGLSPVNSMTAWLRETVLASGISARLISGPPLSLS